MHPTFPMMHLGSIFPAFLVSKAFAPTKHVITKLLPLPGLQRDLLPGDAGRPLPGRRATLRGVPRPLARHPARPVEHEERRWAAAAPRLRGPRLRLGRLPEAGRVRGGARRLLPRREWGRHFLFILDRGSPAFIRLGLISVLFFSGMTGPIVSINMKYIHLKYN